MAGPLSPLLVVPAASHPEDARHILADSSLTDEPIRVLKHGDTFAVFDQYGDIRPGSSKEEGLYYDGTRFLSRLVLELEGARPFFLSSTIRDDNDQLTVALTNPDLCREGRVYLPLGSLHLGLKKFLWQGVCYQELHIENYGTQPADVGITIQFAADFADIYEVRGLKRKARGQDLEPEVSHSRVALRYRGLDRVVRRTLLQFTPPPALLDATQAQFRASLLPKQSVVVYLAVGCEREPVPPPLLHFDQARSAARASLDAQKDRYCRIEAPNGQFNAWVKRAASDLHMMTTMLPTGPYPYAGVPWFNTPFGRDGLITALECLWLQPELARGVLAYLASTQATEVIPEQDAEPGKILHETRNGEMAALGEMPFARYYGSVDATPLFVHFLANTTNAPETGSSLRASGRTSKQPYVGCIDTVTVTKTVSSSIVGSALTVWCIKRGRIPMMQSSTPTVRWLTDQSPCVRCRATLTPHGARGRRWQPLSALRNSQRISPGGQKRYEIVSTARSGAMRRARTPWLWMATSVPARCGHRMPVNAFSPVSRFLSEPRASRRRFWHPSRFPVGASARSQFPSPGTTRWVITPAASGPTTMR